KQAILNEDASKVLEADIKEDEILIKGIKDGTMYGESSDVVEERLNKNKYMFDNNIIPIYDVTMTSYNFLIDIGKEILPLFLIILMFLFNGDITSKDSEMGTYKILLIQPMKRVKILYSKIIASIIASMIMILGTLSIFFISLGFIKGLGSSNYPMSFYDVSSDEIINIGIAKFCGYFVILLIFLMIFYVSLSTLISIISNNSTTSIGVSITLGISIFILNTQYKIAPKIAHLNPFTYMNIPNILNGTILKQFENTNINYKYCLGVIVFFTILNIVISTFIFKKRDVIC
ncbi:MAG: ABC transporter permease subunit, partial [Clostridiaceae bacterium]